MSIPGEQAETAAFLRGLAGGDPVETPISAVFVGADRVWKMRKAVTLTFLDFSTLAERGRTARREFALNAPTAVGMYRDAVPVTRRLGAEGGLEFAGPGEVVEWVVRMARVPEGDFLDVIAARSAMTPALLDALADTVAHLHGGLPPAERDAVGALRHAILGNHASGLAAGLPALRVDAWRDGMLARLEVCTGWLAGRGVSGFIRRTHGDLHLGNLCLWQGRPVPFDALEFSEAMATIDLGYDLAFLLMDLEVRCGRAAANRVLNRYVARTGDAALVTGLPMFLSMRALVRAHVSCKGGRDWEGYLAYAERALEPAACVVIGIGGLPGTGKSTLARALAPLLGPAPGALVLRSDETRKRRHGVAPEERLPKDAYAEPVSRAVMGEVFALAAAASGAGHAVIADLTFMAEADRVAVAEAAGGVPFVGLWLEAPLDILEQRVAARTGDASDADVAVLHRAAASNPGPGTWHRIDASGDGALRAAMALLAPHLTHSVNAC